MTILNFAGAAAGAAIARQEPQLLCGQQWAGERHIGDEKPSRDVTNQPQPVAPAPSADAAVRSAESGWSRRRHQNPLAALEHRPAADLQALHGAVKSSGHLSAVPGRCRSFLLGRCGRPCRVEPCRQGAPWSRLRPARYPTRCKQNVDSHPSEFFSLLRAVEFIQWIIGPGVHKCHRIAKESLRISISVTGKNHPSMLTHHLNDLIWTFMNRRSWPLYWRERASFKFAMEPSRTTMDSSTCWRDVHRRWSWRPPTNSETTFYPPTRSFPGSTMSIRSQLAPPNCFSITFSKVNLHGNASGIPRPVSLLPVDLIPTGLWNSLYYTSFISIDVVTGVVVASVKSAYWSHIGVTKQSSLNAPSNSDLFHWLAVQSALACINSKLRIPLGKPQDTFLSIEGIPFHCSLLVARCSFYYSIETCGGFPLHGVIVSCSCWLVRHLIIGFDLLMILFRLFVRICR